MQEEKKSAHSEQQHTEQHDDRVFFSLLEKAGIMGKYQIITIIIMCMIGFLTGGLILITPYLFYQDPYECPNSVTGTCSDYVCSLPLDQRGAYISQTPIFSSLADKFGDFRCSQERLKIALVMTLMYVGDVIGFLCLTLVGDLMGRKTLLLGNMIAAAVGMLITIFCVNINMAGAGLFLVTGGLQNSFNMGFYFMAETMSEQNRQKCSIFIPFFYGIGVLSNALWFYTIGKWQVIMLAIYLSIVVIVIIGIIFFIRDTPICLVTRYSADVALKEFSFIAQMNDVKDFSMTEQEIVAVRKNYQSKLSKECSQPRKKFSVIDLCRFDSLRPLTFKLIVLQCTIIFGYYAPALMLAQFKLNIFINGIVVAISEILAYPLCYCMITKVKRKTIAYCAFTLIFIFSIILIFIWDQGKEEGDDNEVGKNIGVLVFIFLFRFSMTIQYTFFYIYYNELYPTQIRILGTGLVSTTGGIMLTVAPQIINACMSSGFPIMILFAVLSCFSGIISSRLPETLAAAPHDEIQQLREIHDHPPTAQAIKSKTSMSLQCLQQLQEAHPPELQANEIKRK